MNKLFQPPTDAGAATMPVLILDPDRARRVREEYEAGYPNPWDEVWDGVYVMVPLPNNEHQDVGAGLVAILRVWLDRRYRIFPGCNVSDRAAGWTDNYRCPDVAVYGPDNPAENCGTHWRGGPDFLVEILSPGDRAHDKLPFYASISSREVMIVGRDPWRLELYRLQDGQLLPAGQVDVGSDEVVASAVLPVSFSLLPGPERPVVRATHADGRTWDA